MKQHLAALDAKAARLSVTLAPDAPAGTAVTIDGEALPAASLGTELPIDAGPHVVIASAPGAPERQHAVTIADGERKRLAVAPEKPAAPAAASEERPDAGKPIGWKIGVAAVGAGGAAILAGIGVGVAALGKRSTLAEKCDAQRTCPSSQQATIDAYHALGGASTGLIISGAALAAGGAALMVIAPGAKRAQSGWIAPEIGPGTIGVRGRF